MSRLLFIAGALALAGTLRAQEIVRLETRSGVSQSFFIADMGGRKAEAAALLLIGGGGNINLRMEDGQIRFGQMNFLPRARREFHPQRHPAGDPRQSERPAEWNERPVP